MIPPFQHKLFQGGWLIATNPNGSTSWPKTSALRLKKNQLIYVSSTDFPWFARKEIHIYIYNYIYIVGNRDFLPTPLKKKQDSTHFQIVGALMIHTVYIMYCLYQNNTVAAMPTRCASWAERSDVPHPPRWTCFFKGNTLTLIIYRIWTRYCPLLIHLYPFIKPLLSTYSALI